MSLERGGRGDKGGNQYEDRFFAKLLLDVLLERLTSIEVEPLGYEGTGVEYIAIAPDGEKRYYQCKASNGLQNFWRPYDLDRYDVFQRAKDHILNGEKHAYYFISPVPYDELDTLCDRARTCNGTEEAFAEQVSNASLRKWKEYCEDKFQTSGPELIYLLSHCYFQLEPTGEGTRQSLERIISALFIENNYCSSATIRILLERFANDQSYWGRPIRATDVVSWLEKQGIQQRILEQDSRCLPRIRELNSIYADRLSLINSQLIHRKETDELLTHIRNGKSAVLQGNAGTGKSGCIRELIQALEANSVPYLVLSLDKDHQERVADQFGRSLGLPDSPVASLYRLSGKQRCVLIFDQMDALRWTNSRTSTMLDVCKTMIRQIQQFNSHEGGKIVCIFAVRTFDFETDPGLRNLLKPSLEKDEGWIQWQKITVGPLPEEEVQRITGTNYLKLSKRLRTLLQTPSNLYIWTQIKSETRNSVTSLFGLMDEWRQQILSDCESMGVERNATTTCLDQLIASMRNRESLFVPLLQIKDRKPIEALASCGVLKIVEKKVFFFHQSFFDYSLVADNFLQLSQGKRISALIGDVDKQTPDVRYQLLMLLQYLLEADFSMFLDAYRDLLEGQNIRHYFRCCAIEVLGQCTNPDRTCWDTLSAYLEDPKWHAYLLYTVFRGHPAFIRLLMEHVPNYPWHEAESRNLLCSIVQEAPELVWSVLQTGNMNALSPNELYEIVCGCTISSSEIFSLRIRLLSNNPELLQNNFALYDLIDHKYVQAIHIVKAWISLNPDCRKNVNFPDGEMLESYVALYYETIINELLLVILETANAESVGQYRSDWFFFDSHVSSERQIVQFIQLALNQVAAKRPDHFFKYVAQCEHIDSPIKQELFLHGMELLPTNQSDEILNWLLSDFDAHVFEETSIEETELSCCQRIVKRFSPYCSTAVFTKLEQVIVQWKPQAKSMLGDYQRRIECHKMKGGGNYYIPFWGELQRILLPMLDPARISPGTKELIAVLYRKFPKAPQKYNISHIGMAQFVTSPISGHLEKIKDKSWLRLITSMSNYSLEERTHQSLWSEATPPMFARDLATAAKKEPVRFAQLSLKFPSNVYEGFAEAVVNALESSEVSLSLTCKVLRCFCQNPSKQMAIYFAGVLRDRPSENWPPDIISNLIAIACQHDDPKPGTFPLGSYKKIEKLNCEDLILGSINCARGCAFIAISELLWKHSELAVQFNNVTLKHAAQEESTAVLFAVMCCAVPWYNIDKAYSKELFDTLLERDLRTLGVKQAGDLLNRFYVLSPQFYTEKLRNACESSIADLRTCAAQMIANLAIMDCWTTNDILELALDEQQMDIICRQAVIHFNHEKGHVRCKQLILTLAEHSTNLSSLSLLLHNQRIQISRDKDFLAKLLETKCYSKIYKDTLHYLREVDVNFRDCSDILLIICKAFSYDGGDSLRYHIDDLIFCVARLFHAGKNDPAILRTCLDIWDEIYRFNPTAVQPLMDLLE